MQDLVNKLTCDISKLGLDPDEGKVRQLMDYAALLVKWNKTYSLTAITDTLEIIKYHILDALAIIPHLIDAKTIIDIGSGMGVPGIILAIWQTDSDIVVLDSNHKKTAFLQQVKIELGLSNLKIIASRVEEYTPTHKFDIAISRAFSSSDVFVSLASHLVKDTGYLMLMKGQNVQNEVKLLINKYAIIELYVPEVRENRFLLKINP